MSVIVLDNPWLEAPPSPTSQRAARRGVSPQLRRWAMSACAAVCTLIVHSLLLVPLLLGTGPSKSPPRKEEGLALSPVSGPSEEEGSLFIIVNDLSVHPSNESEQLAKTSMERLDQAVLKTRFSAAIDLSSIPEPNLSDLYSEDTSEAVGANGDGAQLVALFGRYMGQIKSRIERAWTPPAGAPATHFRCKVQIKQTKQGEVQEVTLQRCDPDAMWQLSLVRAIQSASPLSAPPSEDVFTSLISLDFQSQLDVAAARSAHRYP